MLQRQKALLIALCCPSQVITRFLHFICLINTCWFYLQIQFKSRVLELKKDLTVIAKFQNFESNAFRKATCLQFTSIPTTFIYPSHFHTYLVSEALRAVVVDWRLWGAILQRPSPSCLKWQWISLVTLPGWIWRSYFFFNLFFLQSSFISICYCLKSLLT